MLPKEIIFKIVKFARYKNLFPAEKYETTKNLKSIFTEKQKSRNLPNSQILRGNTYVNQ